MSGPCSEHKHYQPGCKPCEIFESFKNIDEKPIAKVLGEDGNVFNLIGICLKAMKKAGIKDKCEEMTNKVTSANSYDEALLIMQEYVEFE